MYLEDPGIYYEIYGKGRPVIILNGIMMSTSSWRAHIERWQKKFQVITYDTRDQGKSARITDKPYTIEVHVEDLKKLVDHLGLKKVNLMGVSYGAQIAELFTLKYPEMIDKLLLSNATDHIDNYLKSIGQAWKVAAELYDGEKFFDISLPYIYSRPFYNNNYEWLMNRRKIFKETLTKDWFDGFVRLASSNETFDIRNEISNITAKTLFISGEEDIITPKSHIIEMSKKVKNSLLANLENTGHALFFEKFEEFCLLVEAFFNND
ncbi:alpha/beta fold hydrolase [Petrotoga olearia]|uniref:Alpha/beta hydrolase n=2 Tax=Petrotoga olearia TaxID=156203 RepID=A0A2K1P2E6_9BACT|nr:alpha/beta hydrolase [Petrotoga olearia]PNR96946.1 alpha/beta hydrolase [Petrotoga olearia DSM 13574]RMA68727.1 pimeloyl-ACP methyl ester carboxylesterase [Petrotoga olearia]